MLLLSKSILGLLLAATYARAVTLFLAGDSTMAVDDGKPDITGWGSFVDKYLDIKVVNLAVSGESARSYTEQGLFKKLIDQVGEGDIVVSELGHNDLGGARAPKGSCPGDDVETTCNVNGTIVYTFNKYIEDAVKALQSKSVEVIVSSQTPNNPYKRGFDAPRFVKYAAKAASDTGASYVDHFNLVANEYKRLGEATVNSYFPLDYTHTSPAGAEVVAQTFVRGVLCDYNNPLFSHVVNKTVAGQCV